ncbi:MAG: type II secretion system F family protein [Phycisphaerae bacterium]|nr:type II secretion system F family protein [Phycisphaerae bacterium]
MFDHLDIIDLIVAIAVFGLVLCVWVAFLLIRNWRQKSTMEKLRTRLGLKMPEHGRERVLRLWHEGKETTTVAPDEKRRRSLSVWLKHIHRAAGWDIPMGTLILGLIGAELLVFVVTALLARSRLAGLGAVVVVLIVFWSLVRRRINKRTAVLEKQLVDALGLAARSLRVGHPILGAFGVIAQEIPTPIGPIFAEICQAHALGVSLEDAIRRAGVESYHPDLRMFATAVIIQLHSGGNLADMMERLATVIRHRIRLKWRVRILTSQTQFSKRVLLALPIFLFVLLNLLNPGYVEPLYTTTAGKMLLVIGVAGLVLGAWIMNRLAVLRY